MAAAGLGVAMAGQAVLGMMSAWSLDLASSPGTPARSSQDIFLDLRGEWHVGGAGFVCRVTAKQQLSSSDVKDLARACLHMGPFVIGADAQTVKSALGEPHRTLPQPNETTAWVYFLEAAGQHPYLIVTERKNSIVALQVTGPAAAKGYAFNHIELGASIEILRQHFGAPRHIGPSGVKDTDLWSYGVWPFSFEVKDERVVSIRINDPAGR